MNIISEKTISQQINNSNNMLYIKSIIEAPYERVLNILQETMKTLQLASKFQSKLFHELQWVVKIIKSHLLYSYEIKEKTYVEELSKNDPDFKQFVDFVSAYNEQVIEMNKKSTFISNELLQKPSFKLKRKFTNNQKICFSNKRSNSNDMNKNQKEKITINCLKKVLKQSFLNKTPNNAFGININFNDNKIYNNHLVNHNNANVLAPIIIKSKNSTNMSYKNKLNTCIFNNYNSFSGIKENKTKQITPLNMLKPINLNISNDNSMNINTTVNYLNKINKFLNKNTTFKKVNNNLVSVQPKINIKHPEMDSLEKYSYIYIDHLLKQYNYDTKHITEKDFNIFELKQIVGQNNVLPLMGRVILETFSLKDDKIINVSKLDGFLYAVSSQYLSTTLYHNNMHGADITQTICLYFLNSNAEKMFQTTVLDLLSIFIAALGHDIGHPGLTNNFHINASTELAITYNDASCLENFHCCKLFKILKKDETNIFEKLSINDYKDIRKRMISEILATDMFYHKEVMSTIQTLLPQIKNDKYEFISDGKEAMKKDQQILLDYFIHSADLAHNTKLFHISLKWVELLSEEFWLQGDKEKSMGLTVSFLCDRKDTNVPSSQVNFIRGFIIPTFQVLVTIFPSLGYTVENATNNMNEWQKLVDAHRLKGWTPRNVNNNSNNSDENKNLNKNNYSNNSSSIKKNNNLSNNTADKNDTKSSKDKDNILRPNINKWKPEKINI
jgi:hypothetical protein